MTRVPQPSPRQPTTAYSSTMPKAAGSKAPDEIRSAGVCYVSAMRIRPHMTDIVDEQTRSRMMAGIRGKDTKPEMALRRALHSQGFRYRLHVKGYAGRPDLLLPRFNAAIFIHGCFWHRHEGCRYATTPQGRREFWQSKFEANVARDWRGRAELMEHGWRVATVWECALRRPERVETATEILAAWLLGTSTAIDIGEADVLAKDPLG